MTAYQEGDAEGFGSQLAKVVPHMPRVPNADAVANPESILGHEAAKKRPSRLGFLSVKREDADALEQPPKVDRGGSENVAGVGLTLCVLTTGALAFSLLAQRLLSPAKPEEQQAPERTQTGSPGAAMPASAPLMSGRLVLKT